jgi:hypothetical protein
MSRADRVSVAASAGANQGVDRQGRGVCQASRDLIARSLDRGQILQTGDLDELSVLTDRHVRRGGRESRDLTYRGRTLRDESRRGCGAGEHVETSDVAFARGHHRLGGEALHLEFLLQSRDELTDEVSRQKRRIDCGFKSHFYSFQ